MEPVAVIKKVFLDNLSENGKTDVSLTIYLTNGWHISLNLNEKSNDPRFLKIFSREYVNDPDNDGNKIIWPDGAAMALNEISEILREDSGGRILEARPCEGSPDEFDVMLPGGHLIAVKLPPEYVPWGSPHANVNRVVWPDGRHITLNELLREISYLGLAKKRPPPYIAVAACAAAVFIIFAAARLTGFPPFKNMGETYLIVEEDTIPLGMPHIADKIVIPAGMLEIDAKQFLETDAANERIYIKTIFLEDTGEVLYEAESGADTAEISMKRGLDSGRYKLRIIIRERLPDGTEESETEREVLLDVH